MPPKTSETKETIFAVVIFEDDGTVEVVPLKWFKDGFCFWPKGALSSQVLEQMVEEVETPDEISFYRMRASVIYKTNNIKRANEICAEVIEEMESTDEDQPRSIP